MSENQPVYLTEITVKVLSEGPLPSDDLSLAEIGRNIVDGDWSGVWEITNAKPLSPQEAVDAALAQGSDPDFLGIDTTVLRCRTCSERLTFAKDVDERTYVSRMREHMEGHHTGAHNLLVSELYAMFEEL